MIKKNITLIMRSGTIVKVRFDNEELVSSFRVDMDYKRSLVKLEGREAQWVWVRPCDVEVMMKNE